MQRWLRFVAGGIINTGFTYFIYLGLNQFLLYQFAYLIAYAIGTVFAYWFNAKFVFHAPFSWKGFFTYPAVYIAQYAISSLLLGGIVEIFHVNKKIAPLIVAAMMIPAAYLMNKFFLDKRSRNSPIKLTQHDEQ